MAQFIGINIPDDIRSIARGSGKTYREIFMAGLNSVKTGTKTEEIFVPDAPVPEKLLQETPQKTQVSNRNLLKEIEEKRAELEVKRLEAEIEKIKKPDTHMDYWAEVLKINQEHAKAVMEMQAKQFELRLEFEKLKFAQDNGTGEDSFATYLDMIKPYIPQIMQSLKSQAPQQTGELPRAEASPTPGARDKLKKKGENVPTEKEIEDFKEQIRNGKIGQEEAYKRFCKETPQYAKAITREQFNIEFDKIRKSKSD